MSEQAPKKPARTKPCAKCGKDMPANRSVCAECGHMTAWFQVRLAVGCISLGLGGLAILISFAMAIWGPVAPQ